jgi:hypothetical protein
VAEPTSMAASTAFLVASCTRGNCAVPMPTIGIGLASPDCRATSGTAAAAAVPVDAMLTRLQVNVLVRNRDRDARAVIPCRSLYMYCKRGGGQVTSTLVPLLRWDSDATWTLCPFSATGRVRLPFVGSFRFFPLATYTFNMRAITTASASSPVR